MLPLTMLVAQKFANLLALNNVLPQQIAAAAQSCNLTIPLVTAGQIVLTAVAPELGDMDVGLTYPRVCVYSTALKNSQTEKFRTLSGSVSVVAEIWASGPLVANADQWIHFYVDGVTSILRQNMGDWNDGVFFAGLYDVQFQGPKSGGLGFIESAKITVNLQVSQN
jgi:hypothetical protein